MDYRPVSQLVDDSSPIEFSFTGSVDMVDLKNTELYVKAWIVNSTGGNITEDECVAPKNLLLHTLFEKVDVTIQGKQMTHVMGSYPNAVYMKTIICLGADNNHMESIGFKLDQGMMDATGLMPKVDPSDITEVRKYNSRAHHRGSGF